MTIPAASVARSYRRAIFRQGLTDREAARKCQVHPSRFAELLRADQTEIRHPGFRWVTHVQICQALAIDPYDSGAPQPEAKRLNWQKKTAATAEVSFPKMRISAEWKEELERLASRHDMSTRQLLDAVVMNWLADGGKLPTVN